MKFYKCNVCGNIVEKIVDKNLPITCCGQQMEELSANTSDGALEKHVPDVKIEDGILHAVIGSVIHPSLQEHHISFIVVETTDYILRKNLKVNETPEAYFNLSGYEGPITVYEYCNLHGLWKKEV